MVQCYRQMVTSKSFPRAENNNPKVVIAFDEAHVLYDDSKSRFSRANVLLRTIKGYSEYRKEAVWVVFASTTSKVVHFAPPKALCT